MSETREQLLEVVNPYDRTVIGSVPLSNWTMIDGYLDRAQQLYKNQSQWLPAYQRIDILKKTAKLLAERFEELAFQIANEGGKPLIDARVEVTRAIDGVEICIKEMANMVGTEIPMGLTKASANRMAFTTREPIGPVVSISAFNHPLNLVVHQVGPAIATGCPVLIKPARDTPLSCKAFVDILYEAGLPEDWCRFVACDSSLAEKMATDPRVAFVSFIGSAKVGWMLRSKLANGTRCALEHGGVAPLIFDESADMDAMLPSVLKGGFYHSGQVCVSVQRIYAPKSLAKSFAKKLAAAAEKLVVGNAIDEKTECGPLIQPREVDRIEEWVDEAQKLGATVLTGGKRLGDTTYAPTVLLNPPIDAKVSTHEVFGPVVCIYEYNAIEDAIKQANALPYAFQSSIFTNNLDTAFKVSRQLDSTAVMINDHTAFRVDWMPFAGRRESGYGIGGIGQTMHEMMQDKMLVFKL
mgnify:CR=1 FL=1